MSDRAGLSLPGAPNNAPNIPENFQPLAWEIFDGLDTKSPRPAIPDKKCAWLDGWMPIGPSNLRVLWGTGPVVNTSSRQVLWFGFGNIGDTPYGVKLTADGEVAAFSPVTGVPTTIMSAGTILNPSSIFGFSQWGSQYLLFTKDQENGYWVWDGTNLFTAGTIAPVVTLSSVGSTYASAPLIAFSTTGTATLPTAHAVVENGTVTQVLIDTPGSGFAIDDLVAMSFAGGGSDDQATASPDISSAGGVAEVIVRDPGSSYTGAAKVVFAGGGGTGAAGYASIVSGGVSAIAISNPGVGYTDPPSVSIVDPGLGSGSSHIAGGSGFIGQVVLNFGQITGITPLYGGTNYTGNPVVKIIGDGTGATAQPLVVNGEVTSYAMTNYGFGYTKALVIIEGGNNAANADCSIFPYGISGTAIETDAERVWITNGAAVATTPPKNRTVFSDPNTPVGFSAGGGAFQSTDSFLRVGYHWLKQTNGFLYLGGDSSINYISGVQTTATGTVTSTAVTTFSNQNVDPQIGSPWPASVQVFSRNIVLANTLGVFVSYGGAVTKVSEELDGFYGTGPIYSAGSNFPSAVANIFGIPVYMLLLPVVDQFTMQQTNKLLMWDGKRWFTSQQDRPLTFIATQEINSVMTAWGTDGTRIFPLFQQPSTEFTKRAQSKLWSNPAYYTTKTARTLHGVVQSFRADEVVTVSVDTERVRGTGTAARAISPVANGLSWTNNVGQPIAWTNNANQPIVWGVPGLDVFGPLPIGQQGRMLGLTIETDASDLALLSLQIAGQVYSTNL